MNKKLKITCFILIIILLPLFVKTIIELRMKSEYSQKYPEHPTLSDCEKLSGIDRDFCLSDVAEIANDTKQCERVTDPNIYKFCIARITINSTMCEELPAIEWKTNCLESISMKKEWLGIK